MPHWQTHQVRSKKELKCANPEMKAAEELIVRDKSCLIVETSGLSAVMAESPVIWYLTMMVMGNEGFSRDYSDALYSSGHVYLL